MRTRPNIPSVISAAIAAMVVGSVLTACGATSRGHDSARATTAVFGACPGHVEQIRRAPTRQERAAVVPLNPTAGELCVYADPNQKLSLPALPLTALLPETQARTLSLLLDSRGGLGPSCDAGFPALIRLRYQDAHVLSLLATGCDPELLSTPTGDRALSATASLAVGGLLDPPALHGGGGRVRVGDYIGQALPTAGRAARRDLKAAFEFRVSPYELNEPTASFGHVVWQTPLAGSEQYASFGPLVLIVATHRVPPCRADQLEGRYQNGGEAMQSQFGAIDLLDTSPRACSLTGRLSLAGIGATGQPDTNTVSEPIAPPLVLSPRTTLRALARDPAAALIATFSFTRPLIDEANGNCNHRETPTAWSLTLNSGVTVLLANGATGEGGPFSSCRGNLSFALSSGVQLLGSDPAVIGATLKRAR
jgi:hypothetical protein